NDLHRYLEPWTFSRLNAAERCLLAQHLPGVAAATARHERELWELLPPNPDREDQLFETALRGRALSAEEFGLLVKETVAEADLVPRTPGAAGAVAGAAAAPAALAAIPMPALQ